MAGPKDVTVRAQILDGTWEEIGPLRERGLWPTDVNFDFDDWGPSRASFVLNRDPRRPFPGIGAFAPVEFDVGGQTVWDGRVIETPGDTSGTTVTVQCEGWQNHLDDDLYEATYLHADLTAWKDQRAILAADLTRYIAAGQVTVNQGSIVLSFPMASQFYAGACVGVVLDLGPGNVGQVASIDYETSTAPGGSNTDISFFGNNEAQETVVLTGSTTPYVLIGGGVISGALAATDTNDVATDGVLNCRYIHAVLHVNSTQSSLAQDIWVKITGVRVAGFVPWMDYPVGLTDGTSSLTASSAIQFALNRGTLLLTLGPGAPFSATYTPQVQTTSTFIPSLKLDGPQTPRKVWEAVDAFHAWDKQIKVGRIPYYAPKASVAVLEVGNWAPLTDQDASANSGDDIYNRVILTAQAPDGSQLRTSRYTGQGGTMQPLTYQVLNPSFTTNVTDWSTSGDITRDTGVFDSSPASGRWQGAGGVELAIGEVIVCSLSGTFSRGTFYRLRFRARVAAGTLGNFIEFDARLSSGYGYDDSVVPCRISSTALGGIGAGVWATFEVPWIPGLTSTTGGYLELLVTDWDGGAPYMHIDTVSLESSQNTIVGRRGFIRTKELPITSPLPSDLIAANAIADVWLPDHRTTPFRGTLTVSGNQSVRVVKTGQPVPPERLGQYVGQLITFTDRADPDTGNWGRDGRIVDVKCEPKTDSATLTIDNSRQSFEAFVQRLAVFST